MTYSFKASKFLGIFLFVAVIGGIVTNLYLMHQLKIKARLAFIDDVKILTQMLDKQQLAELIDVKSPRHAQSEASIRQKLTYVRIDMAQVKYVYLLQRVNDQIVFLSDSEAADAPDASLFGDVYHQATPELKRLFDQGTTLLEGPVADQWGEWITAAATIYDDEGNVMAVAGMDIDANQWDAQFNLYRFNAIVMSLLLLGLLCLVWFYLVGMNHWMNTERITRKKAMHDSLTGLPNRSYIMDILPKTIYRAKRYGHKFAVLFIDINDLKLVNDLYGHTAGDALLQEVAHRLKVLLRSYDHIGRIGGDEFVIIIEKVTMPEDVEIVISKIKTSIEQPIDNDKLAVYWGSCSVGFAIYPDHGLTIDQLLTYADNRMYIEKRLGKKQSTSADKTEPA